MDRGAAFLDKSAASRPRAADPAELSKRVGELYEKGLPPGDSTGWASVDALYTVAPGQLTIVTGWPSSGKSEWVDALLINLARKGWRHAIYSPENAPTQLHVSKLIEKLVGKPFREGPTERMTREELDKGAAWINQRFGIIEPSEDVGHSVAEILEEADGVLKERRATKRGLVLDPWNELEHWRPQGMTETEYVSKTLAVIRRWARRTETHVWLVAHPKNVAREGGKLPIPRLDHVSGSQHFWNKSDCGLTVWRELESPSDDVEIHVSKVRFKHIGRPGMARLGWVRACGRYVELEPVWDGATRRT